MRLTELLSGAITPTRRARYVEALTGNRKCVEGVVVTAGGTGYSNSFAVTGSGGGGTAFAGTAYAVGGVIKYVETTAHGDNYTSAPTLDFSAGGGSAATGSAIMAAKSLASIVTTDLTVGLLVSFAVGTTLYHYMLAAGTDAESSPTIIRPLDYAGGTNEKVWKQLGGTLATLVLVNSDTGLQHELRIRGSAAPFSTEISDGY